MMTLQAELTKQVGARRLGRPAADAESRPSLRIRQTWRGKQKPPGGGSARPAVRQGEPACVIRLAARFPTRAAQKALVAPRSARSGRARMRREIERLEAVARLAGDVMSASLSNRAHRPRRTDVLVGISADVLNLAGGMVPAR